MCFRKIREQTHKEDYCNQETEMIQENSYAPGLRGNHIWPTLRYLLGRKIKWNQEVTRNNKLSDIFKHLEKLMIKVSLLRI